MSKTTELKEVFKEVQPLIESRTELLEKIVDKSTDGFFKIDTPKNWAKGDEKGLNWQYDMSIFFIRCSKFALQVDPHLDFRAFEMKDEYKFLFACQDQLEKYKNEFEFGGYTQLISETYTRAFEACLKAIDEYLKIEDERMHSKSERYPRVKPHKKEDILENEEER